MDRREFLNRAAIAAAGVLAGGCASQSDPSRRVQPSKTTTTLRRHASTTIPPTTTTTIETPLKFNDFAAGIEGRVIDASHAEYVQLSRLNNTAFDTVEPQIIVQVASPNDVASTLQYATSNQLPIAVRCGGHSYLGASTTNGVVIDLRGLDTVTVDVDNQRATIGAGAQLVDVYQNLAAVGQTLPAGSCPTVGIGGLALGGGHGLTSRAYGLTCDAITELQIVTADGNVLRVSDTQNSELFWACRGGGGSFGVVTAFTFATVPVPAHTTTFVLRFDWSNAAEGLLCWSQWLESLPRSISTIARLETSKHLIIAGLSLETAAATEAQLAPFRTTQSRTVRQRNFIEAIMLEAGCAQRSRQACHTSGLPDQGELQRAGPFAASSLYFDQLTSVAIEQAISAINEHDARVGSSSGSGSGSATIQFDAYGGAIRDLAPGDTAFVHRNALCSAQIASFVGSRPLSVHRDWVTETRALLLQFSNRESYQNYPDPTLNNWPEAYYGTNLARLRQVKSRYDPANTFTFPQSIVPE